MTTEHGYLLILALMAPVIGAMMSFLLGGRSAQRIALVTACVGVAIASAIVVFVLRSDAALVYVLGGWKPPLGVSLRADGMSAALLLATALIMLAVTIAARDDFGTPEGAPEARAPLALWVLLQGVWASLVAAFICNDLFSLYVALELMTFAAVPLVSIEGSAKTLRAALRYLLFALIGSLAYLLGAALIYSAYGTLDITLLAERVAAAPSITTAVTVATALMVTGLLAKTALFPLHLWLPPAHGGAPPAASAVLSSLVVKGSFFIVLRLWFDVLPGAATDRAAVILGALGAAAIIHGSVMALQQDRLKLLIAYSTVAQIGYLFLVFPLADHGGAITSASQRISDAALSGGVLQAVSHAFAKASMFLSAGLLATACGSDRMVDLRGAVRIMPVTVLAIAISGLSLIGLPPSGGFWAKWRLLTASVETGQWWWAVVIFMGGGLAVAYIVRVLSATLDRSCAAPPMHRRPAVICEAVTLALALVSLLLGLLAFTPVDLMLIGRPASIGVMHP